MLVDTKVVEKIIRAADISHNEIVLEAGTGRGVLTSELCNLAKRVVSCEIDRKLFEKATLELEFDNLKLVRGDLFDTQNLEFDVFVSNLPYSRSRDAIEWLAAQKFDRAVITVQREFAEKLQTTPGKKEYRAISALAGYRFNLQMIALVDKKSFSPHPAVDSVILKVVPRQQHPVSKLTIKSINWLFSKRNRKASTVAAKLGLRIESGEKRIYQLAPSTVVELAERIGNEQDIQAF